MSTKGRLISKLTAESALKHRWLVGFDDTSFPDEDLYESDFGEILGKASTDSTVTSTSSTHSSKAASNSSAPSTRKSALKGKNNKTKESPTVDATVVTPETKHSSKHPASTSKKTSKTVKNGKNSNNKKQRVVNFDLPESGNATTDESSTAASERESKRSAAISAREARSKRRQAHFDVDAGVSQPPNKKAKTSNNSKKKSSTTANSKDVVRIPMLTGTLVLYRGKHRRAEFIRKF